MRSSLFNFLATSAVLISSVSATCRYHSPQDVSDLVSCGDAEAISPCLWFGITAQRLDLIEQCLRDGGCSEEQSLTTSQYVGSNCTASEPYFIPSEEDTAELKKRQRASTSAESSTAVTTGQATAPATTGKTTAGGSTAKPTTPQTTEHSTAADTPTTTSATTSASSTIPSSTDSSTSVSTPASTTTTPTTTNTALAATTSGPLTCLSTSLLSTTWCWSITTDANPSATSCVATTTPSVACGPGLICGTTDKGDTSCMVRDNHLTVSGLVMAIVFGAAALGMLTALVWMSCASRAVTRRKRRMQDMGVGSISGVSGTGRSILGANRNGAASDANLPLMQMQGPAGGQHLDGPQYKDHSSISERRTESPRGYTDTILATPGSGDIPPLPPPKLHSGLMSTPSEIGTSPYKPGNLVEYDIAYERTRL